MSLKSIIDRAEQEKRKYDHIAWRGICMKCGLECNIFSDKCKRLFGSEKVDVRGKEIRCENQRCRGRIKVYGRLPSLKAIHLNDIRRRNK